MFRAVGCHIQAFNRFAGFEKEITVGDTDIKVSGYSEHFLAPGDMFSQDKKEDESFSFVIGKIQSFRDVRVELGDNHLDFVLIQLETALGTIPVAAGRHYFDLGGIAQGKVVPMNAYIKADLSE